MDSREEIREFLTSRRAKVTPEQAKLPAYGGNRRVTGLRREEVAMLAGVSVDYYTKLERGNFGTVSEGVLEALAGALQLDEAEREHLFHLANASATIRPVRRPASPRTVRASVQRVIDGLADAPAFVRNQRRDLLAANAVASLRTEVGRSPHNRELHELISELSTHSDEFRAYWASHDVRYHDTGFKAIHHPVVGDVHLTFEALELPADPGQALIVYGTEPGSASEDALRLLASWAATMPTPAGGPLTDKELNS